MLNASDLILNVAILSIIARDPEGTSGYKITQDVRAKMPNIPESTFFPLLKQMETDGYLEAFHKDLGGRSRLFYKITNSGVAKMIDYQNELMNYMQQANSLMNQQAATTTEQVQPTQTENVETVEETSADSTTEEAVSVNEVVENSVTEEINSESEVAETLVASEPE